MNSSNLTLIETVGCVRAIKLHSDPLEALISLESLTHFEVVKSAGCVEAVENTRFDRWKPSNRCDIGAVGDFEIIREHWGRLNCF